MADPLTLALAGAALARTAVEAQAASAEARGHRRDAAEAAARAEREFEADRRKAASDAAAMRARFAASGVAPAAGSSLLALEEQARASDFRARLRRFETLAGRQDPLDRADRARSRRATALLGAGSSLLSGRLRPFPTPGDRI